MFKTRKSKDTMRRVAALTLAFLMVFQYTATGLSIYSWAEDGSEVAEEEQKEKVELKAEAEEKIETPAEPKAEEPKEEAPQEEPKAEQPKEEPQQEAPEEKPAEEPAPAEEPEAEPVQEVAEEPAAEELQVEEEKPEEEEKEDDEEEEEKFPAQSFVKTSSGTTVRIDAPEGALPEGADVVVTAVAASAVEAKIESVAGGDIKVVKALDISFRDKDGKEIEPEKKVAVNFENANFSEINSTQVYHIADNGATEKLPEKTVGVYNDQVSINVQDFSVYVVVDTGENARLTVTFMNGETEIASMLVKKLDIANIEQVVYDPGAGELDDDEVFRGWTQDPDFDGETAPQLTIEDVRDQIIDRLDEMVQDETDTITYYAMVFNNYHVTYLDQDGVTIKTDERLFRTDETASYKVNMPYTPKDQDENFEGWAVVEDGAITDTVYQNEQEITLDGNLVLRAYVPKGAWLVFDENGKGASYTTPQFIKTGQTTAEPADPTRFGYTFGGWYKDKACTDGNEFTFNQTLSEKQTVYAKWIAVDEAGYTVIIWKQKIVGDEYDFEQSFNFTGDVNAVVDIVEAHDSGDAAYASIDGTDYKYTGFHLKDFDQNVTIVPEGNAIVNVYYDRNIITLKFFVYGSGTTETYVEATDNQTPQYGLVDGEYIELTRNGEWWSGYTWTYDSGEAGYVPATDSEGTQYGLVDGEYVELTRNGSWITGYTWSYATGNYIYTATNSNSTNPPKFGLVDGEYVPLYRQGGQWYYGDGARYRGTRYTRTEETVRYTGTRYKYQDVIITYTGTRYKKRISNWSEAYTFTGRYGSTLSDNGYTWPVDHDWHEVGYNDGTTGGMRTTFLDAFLPTESAATINFYGSEPTEGRTVEFYKQKPDGSGYELANTVQTTDYGTFSISDKYSGFRAHHYTVDGGNPVQLGEKDEDGYYATGVAYYDVLRIYYNCSKYKINYMDGAYFTGENNIITDEAARGQLKEVDDIAFGADVKSYNKGKADYFEPKYAGYAFEGWYSDKACTHEYTFSTMPDGGITVYARWRRIQYRVFMHPNADTDPTLDWGNENAQTSFRVDYGEKINGMPGIRDDYDLIGWYMDEDCTRPFNFDSYVLNDETVTQTYDKSRSTELNKYGIADSEENKDINRFWITKCLDLYAKWRSKLVGAKGINVEYDANGGTGAPTDNTFYSDEATAKAGAASKPANAQTHQFKYWVVQKWDEGSGKYIDTDTTVLPGAPFTVLKAYAKRTQNPDHTEEEPSYTYMVRLRAEYSEIESETFTHIYWYKNDGTAGPIHKDGVDPDKLSINEGVNIQAAPSREGYEFIGWAKVNEPSNTDTYAPEDVSGTMLVYYNDADSKFYREASFQNEAKKVAADEAEPYEILVGVWKPKLQIEITGHTAEEYYDGTQKSVSGYDVKYKVGKEDWTTTAPTGVTVALAEGKTAEAKGTDVNTDPGYLMGLTKDSFTISAANYKFNPDKDLTVTDGWLKILDTTLQIKITGATDTKSYSGSEQSVSGYTVQYKVADGSWTTTAPQGVSVALASGKTAEAKGTNVDGGTNPDKTYPMGLAADSFTINAGGYTFDPEEDLDITDGWLKIIPVDLTVEIEGNTNTLTYNGGEQSVTGYTVTIPAGAKLTEADIVGPEAAEAKGTNVNTDPGYPMGLKVNEFSTTNKNYNVTFDVKDGWLKITKATLMITAAAQEYTYNGKPQGEDNKTYTEGFDSKVTVATLLGQDALTSIKLNGKETDAGEYDDKIVPSNAVIKNASDQDVTGNYNITYVEGKLTINKKEVTITADNASQTYNGSALTEDGFTNTELEEGDTHEFEVVMTDDSTITNAGTQPNVIAKVDNVEVSADEPTAVGNYIVTIVPGTLTVSPKAVTITAGSANKEYDGTPLTQLEFKNSALETGDTHEFEVVMTDDSTITNHGTQANVIATVDGTAVTTGEAKQIGNYIVTTVNGTLTITEDSKALVITSDTKSWPYDGGTHKSEVYTVTYNGSPASVDSTGKVFGLPNGDVVTITATAAGVKDVSDNADQNNTFTYTITNADEADVSGNYSNKVINVGTLTINPKAVTITAGSDSKTYDSYPLTQPEFTVEGLAETDTHEFIVVMTDSSTITNYGTQPNVIASVDGTDVTTGQAVQIGNYTVTTVNGLLTINKATVTITAKNQEYTYNAKPQGEDNATYTENLDGKVKVEGLAKNDELTSITLNGYETDAGYYYRTIVPNDAEIGNATGNYEIEYVSGLLQIDPAALTITAKDQEFTYNGQLQGHGQGAIYEDPAAIPEVVDVEGLKGDDSIYWVAMFSQAKDVGSYTYPEDLEGPYVSMYAIQNGNNDIINWNYDVNLVGGTLTIKPAQVTITAKDASKVYDGAPLTQPEFTVEGLEESDEHEFAVAMTESSTITYYGTQPNVIATVDDTPITTAEPKKKVGNYEVTVANGTLEITKAPLTITAKDQTDYVYNGKPQGEDNNTYTNADDIPVKVDVDGLVGNDALASITLNGHETNAGEYENKIVPSAAEVGAATDSYDITYVPGMLAIAKNEIVITVKGNTETKPYNGETQKVEGYAAESESDFFDDSKVNYDGDAVAEGKDVSDDGYPMGLEVENFSYDDENVYASFELEEDGRLTITPLAVTVEIEGKKDNIVYNAEEHTLTGYEITNISDPLYKEEYISCEEEPSVNGTNVGDYPLELIAAAFYDQSDDELGASNFEVTFEVTNGSLTITPKTVTVTAEDKSKTVGDDDPELTATVDGLIGDDKVEYTLAREAGEDAGEYAITPSGDAEQGNYAVEFVNGTLIINAPAPGPDPEPTPTPDPEPTPTPDPDPEPTPTPTPDPEPTPTPDPEPTPTPTPTPTPNTDNNGNNNPAPNNDGNPAVNPAAPAPAPAAPAVTDTIEPDDVPTAEPEETITDENPPMSAPETPTWALLNLLCAIASVLLSLIVLVAYLGKSKKKDEENANAAESDEESPEEQQIKKKGILRIMDIIPAVVAVVTFILTEDMSSKMALVDQWTLLMAAILLVDVVVAVFTKKTVKGNGEKQENEQA